MTRKSKGRQGRPSALGQVNCIDDKPTSPDPIPDVPNPFGSAIASLATALKPADQPSVEVQPNSVGKGFSLHLPGKSVKPYFRIFVAEHTNALNAVTPLANIAVPVGENFVVTRVMFRGINQITNTVNYQVLGVDNPYLFGGILRFEISADGTLTSPGTFIFEALNTALQYTAIPLVNVDVPDLLGWKGSGGYGAVIGSGGRLTTRCVQWNTAAGDTTVPGFVVCEVGGFFCPSQYTTAYLSEQDAITP